MSTDNERREHISEVVRNVLARDRVARGLPLITEVEQASIDLIALAKEIRTRGY